MKELNRLEVEGIKIKYPKGTGVQLVVMHGESIPYGTMGTVSHVDDIGQIHVNWDNGTRLPLNTQYDRFTVIKEKQVFDIEVIQIIISHLDVEALTYEDAVEQVEKMVFNGEFKIETKHECEQFLEIEPQKVEENEDDHN